MHESFAMSKNYVEDNVKKIHGPEAAQKQSLFTQSLTNFQRLHTEYVDPMFEDSSYSESMELENQKNLKHQCPSYTTKDGYQKFLDNLNIYSKHSKSPRKTQKDEPRVQNRVHQ